MENSFTPRRTGYARPARRHLSYLLAMSLLAATGARAQTASSYQLTATADAYAPLVGGTAVPAILRDDAVSGSLPIGFTFSFGGVGYTSFQVSSNGLLGFGSSLTTAGADLGNTFTSSQLTGGSLPVLAPFWTDLTGSPGSGASAQYLTSGTAPRRVLTMEWLDYYDLNGDAAKYISFQVVLHEGTGQLEYRYRRGTGGEAGDAAIGLKGGGGSFLSLANAGAAPTTSSTTSYGRLNRPATGQVYAFAPPAAPLATTTGGAAAAIALFPNPTLDAFTVQVPTSPAASTVQAELLNALGEVVRRQATGLPASFTVPTAGLAPGLYTLRLQVGSEFLARRVAVE